MSNKVILGTEADSLRREGLRDLPELWEDGLRAKPEPGVFEWWYFDAHLDDGSTVVIVFFTKSLLNLGVRLQPGVSISITQPDGQKLQEMRIFEPSEFSASKERCYVRIGESWARGDAGGYELHAHVGGLAAHLKMTGIVPPWRPGTGKVYFDEAQTRYFAWLAAVPYGSASGLLTYNNKIVGVSGSCYHDHNWGNIALNEVLEKWYWGRAHIGDYNLIFVEMTASPKYGGQKIPVFMLAKGSQIITGDGAPLRVAELDFQADPGGRSYPTGLDFIWQQASERIHISLRDPALIQSFSLLEDLPAWKRFIGGLFFNPYYFRFDSTLDLRIELHDCQDRLQGKAIYEVMLLR
jgi:predicted secreted hydrolase